MLLCGQGMSLIFIFQVLCNRFLGRDVGISGRDVSLDGRLDCLLIRLSHRYVCYFLWKMLVSLDHALAVSFSSTGFSLYLAYSGVYLENTRRKSLVVSIKKWKISSLSSGRKKDNCLSVRILHVFFSSNLCHTRLGISLSISCL